MVSVAGKKPTELQEEETNTQRGGKKGRGRGEKSRVALFESVQSCGHL